MVLEISGRPVSFLDLDVFQITRSFDIERYIYRRTVHEELSVYGKTGTRNLAGILKIRKAKISRISVAVRVPFVARIERDKT